MTSFANRSTDYPIDSIFLERWSPRAFTDEKISEADLMTMFEAARWAPSSYNSQPWRFVYGLRGTPHFDAILDLLIEFNQGWAKNAAALVVLGSDSMMIPPGKDTPVPSHSHSSDAGSAWAQFSLQAVRMGWHTHGMVGFDMQRAFAELGFTEGCRVEMAFAVGRQGDKAMLPEAAQAREEPSGRNPLSSMVFEGKMSA